MDLSAFSAFNWTAQSANHSSHGFSVASSPPNTSSYQTVVSVSQRCFFHLPGYSYAPSAVFIPEPIGSYMIYPDEVWWLWPLFPDNVSWLQGFPQKKRIYHLAIPRHSDIKNATGAGSKDIKWMGWHSFSLRCTQKWNSHRTIYRLCSGPFTVNRESKILKKSLMARSRRKRKS